jgi:ATP-dependent Lon protease
MDKERMRGAAPEIQRLRDTLERRVVGLDGAKRRLLERAALRAAAPAARGPALLLVGPPGSGKDALLAAVEEGLGAAVPRFALEPLAEGERVAAAEEALAAAAREPLAIATAHHPSDLPPALFRRFETVPLHGYGRAEKLEIARRRLLPEALAAAGAAGGSVEVTGDALARLVDLYAPDAGVHGLERQLAQLVRRAAARIALGEAETARIDREEVRRLLGPAPVAAPGAERGAEGAHGAEVGVAVGLVWAREGAAPVLVEALRARAAAVAPIAAELGGAVEAALAYIRTHAETLRIDQDALFAGEVLIRATGPQGVSDPGALELAVVLALVSLATDRPVRRDVAAAGSVTLRGAVRPVEGAAEKVLAAERAGFRKVVIARGDFPAVEATLPPAVLAGVEVIPVEAADEAAREALIDIVIARGIR